MICCASTCVCGADTNVSDGHAVPIVVHSRHSGHFRVGRQGTFKVCCRNHNFGAHWPFHGILDSDFRCSAVGSGTQLCPCNLFLAMDVHGALKASDDLGPECWQIDRLRVTDKRDVDVLLKRFEFCADLERPTPDQDVIRLFLTKQQPYVRS